MDPKKLKKHAGNVVGIFSLLGIGSWLVDEYVKPFLKSLKWWQFVLIVAAVILLYALGAAIVEKWKKKQSRRRPRKMLKSSREKILEAQTDILQRFFEDKMAKAFGKGWKAEVLRTANEKLDSQYSVYKEIRKKVDEKGLDQVSVKDLDFSALSALCRFDFRSECGLDESAEAREDMAYVGYDRNALSHISDFNDVEHLAEIEKLAVDDLKKLLKHLKTLWTCPEVYKQYLGSGDGDGVLDKLSESISAEISEENAYRADVRREMIRLKRERQDHSSHYIPLSYNRDGKEEEKMLLDELITANLENTKKGMRIVAEGGFGKTWTLYEIAGRYADKYLESSDAGKEVIPILIEMSQLHSDCNTIRKKIASLFLNNDTDKVPAFLEHNGVILFIDAMDEAKAEIRDDVSRELDALKASQPGVAFVCASRKSHIDQYPVTIPLYAIKELDDEQIEAYFAKALPEELREKAVKEWVGPDRKEFLSRNRTPFYLYCYSELVKESGETVFSDTTELIGKYIDRILERERQKKALVTDEEIYKSFLIEFNYLLNSESAGNDVTTVPKTEVLEALTNKIPNTDLRLVCGRLVENRILALDDALQLSFAHQNFKDYFDRKYPRKHLGPFGKR